jgi:hypothetical protein
VRGNVDDDYRVVLDEESLNWCGQTDTELRAAVDSFADLLEPLSDGRQVAVMTPAYSVECWEAVTLVEVSFTTDRRVSRDARLRLAKLIDKCRTIDPQDEDIPQQIRMHGSWRESSWGIAHALTRVAIGRTMCCLTSPIALTPSGWTTVEWGADSVELDIHFLSDPARLPEFLRGIFSREAVPEGSFFALAELAFPRLIFGHGLTFRRFRGSYAEVLPWLVSLLIALDDNFADSLARYRGNQNQVMTAFSTYGLDISPESPQTHNNPKAWAERLVTYDDADYRCEWHGKRLWNYDRVHFSLPIAKYDGRVLIGIFTDHLL